MKTGFSIGKLKFKNRVFVASGTFGYGDEAKDLVDVNKLGGIMTKSLSMKPREGNPPRRITETPCGMLNSIGLANIGVQRFIREKLPYLRSLDTAIIANIAASSVQEYCDVLSALEEQEGVDAYEINVSCPNVREGGLLFGTDRSLTRQITDRLRPLTSKPLILKLTPNVTHISEFAKAVEEAGADAVSVMNTVIGMAVDIWKKKPKLSTVTGGLSGPAIKPIALAKVYEVAQSVKIPIFGIGGISKWEDAVEFLLVGASAVQIGTMNYVNPAASVSIIDGISAYARKQGVDDVGAIVGSMDAKVEFSPLHSWL